MFLFRKHLRTKVFSKHKILEIPDLFELSVGKFMYYLTILITTLLRMHQSTILKQDLLHCKNIIYPE